MYFALGIFVGMRKAEIDHARWEWFDFDSKLITLQSSESFMLKDKDARYKPCERSEGRAGLETD